MQEPFTHRLYADLTATSEIAGPSGGQNGHEAVLAFEGDLSPLVIHGHFEMAEKCHAEQPHRHMAIDVDGDLDVSCLGCAHTQRL